MNNHKKIILTLMLLALPVIHGCSKEDTSIKKPYMEISQDIKDEQRIAKEKSKIEAEIYSELKKLDAPFYRSILGRATSDDVIADYGNVKLFSVKIVCKDVCKIKLFYDKSLLKFGELTDFIEPVHATVYDIAEKNKIGNAEVEVYVNNKLL